MAAKLESMKVTRMLQPCFSQAYHLLVNKCLLLVQAFLKRSISDKAEQHARKMQHQNSPMERKSADSHDVEKPTQCLTLSSSMTMASPLFRM